MAQSSATGVIEGRVFNPATGEYVATARVTVEGTPLETFTDSIGQYRLHQVPAGVARVTAFFTGVASQTANVTVAPGGRAVLDFTLAASGQNEKQADGTVKLAEFVVSSSKEMDGAAIAINEQRFAPNIINVVSADEFGFVAEGNVGEFMKFMPGVTIDYLGGDARTISLSGVPAQYVPVTVGGFDMASAASSSTSRRVELEQVSINNISRIEVTHSPTPESPGSALAGSVNMVPRSAFERSKPVYAVSAFLTMRDNERSLKRTPGPRAKATRKIHPGFDFSFIAPVNKRFGFTVSGANSTNYSPLDYSQNTWRGAGAPTTGITAPTSVTQFPDTTPDKPYLSEYLFRDHTKVSRRSSISTTLDFKLGRYDRISLGLQYTYYHGSWVNRTLAFSINRVNPGDFTTTSTKSAPGGGTLTISNDAREKSGTTYMPTLVWRHDGPIWKADAGVGYSRASNYYRAGDKGFFNRGSARRQRVTIAFDDIFYLRPGRITVTEGTTGAPVDPYSLSSYSLASATEDTRDSSDTVRRAYANLRRDFHGRVPVSLKGGLSINHQARELRGLTTFVDFVGPDGIASRSPADGGDDNAAILVDAGVSTRTPAFGFPKVQWLSNEKYWSLYQTNPEYFVRFPIPEYRNRINQFSRHAEEVISAAYLRADAAFFERRLKFVGGARAEQTNIKAEGPLTDPTLNFRRDANGELVLGENGRPEPIATDELGILQRTLIDRGKHARKEYLRILPSLNVSYNLRENLIARASYAYSLGRPSFAQYAGPLSLPDTESAPSSGNRISVNNVGIKAWNARSTKVRLEYYFARVGQVSVAAFRRDIQNFFGSTRIPVTPEFLALYGLDPEIYGAYDAQTNYNIPGIVRITGLEFAYKQALTFLPNWARGVQVFSNLTAQRAVGGASDNFRGYVPRTMSWGASLSRPKYNVRFNWNYRGRQRQARIGGRGIESGTYYWGSKRLYMDAQAEYVFSKRYRIFANLRNALDTTEDFEAHGPSTPEHAQFRQREAFGSFWTIGVKGTF